MLSQLELRHALETAFLPTKCQCIIEPEGTLTVQLINPRTAEIDLTVKGIVMAKLTSSRALAALVAEIKEELRLKPGIVQDRRRYRR
ncbi:DUF1652 domain-containing protein [Pseudomonas sp. HR96]|uniref:DUF1652 domain-containing protein n=1 Tax=Pseudomonas sp. HR96 TaxID=1027966 RepID=UPI002A75B832|nr:DUF1652 domain-containing protein [Pseudomonas sp. HR96]WPO98227.1 DUF1652 domain-containing protein [Pseudomonas sp. HR96]